MTDRAAPGAQGSTVRNLEHGEAMMSTMGGFIVPADEPTYSAQRWDGLNEGNFAAFDASYSSGSLTVTIQPGEAFIKGWLARDTSTDVELDSFEDGQTVILAWDADAVYSDEIHDSREEADSVIITLEDDLTVNIPYIPLWEFGTDGDGVTSSIDRRVTKPSASFSSLSAESVHSDKGEIETLKSGKTIAHDDFNDYTGDETSADDVLDERKDSESWLSFSSDPLPGGAVKGMYRPFYREITDGLQIANEGTEDNPDTRIFDPDGEGYVTIPIGVLVGEFWWESDSAGPGSGSNDRGGFIQIHEDEDNYIRAAENGFGRYTVTERIDGSSTTIIDSSSRQGRGSASLYVYADKTVELRGSTATLSEFIDPKEIRVGHENSSVDGVYEYRIERLPENELTYEE